MYIQAENGKFYNDPEFRLGDVEFKGTTCKVISTGLTIGAARKRVAEALRLLGITGTVAVHGVGTKTFFGERLVDAYEFEWKPTCPIPEPKVWTGICSSGVPMDSEYICFFYYFPLAELRGVMVGERQSRRLEALWKEGTKSFVNWIKRGIQEHLKLHGEPKGPMVAIYIRAYGYRGPIIAPAFA